MLYVHPQFWDMHGLFYFLSYFLITILVLLIEEQYFARDMKCVPLTHKGHCPVLLMLSL